MMGVCSSKSYTSITGCQMCGLHFDDGGSNRVADEHMISFAADREDTQLHFDDGGPGSHNTSLPVPSLRD